MTKPQTSFPVFGTSLGDVLDAFKKEMAQSINCVLIGKVEEYFPATNTASVSIQEKRSYVNGSTVAFPLLTDCPVFVLNGGGSFLNMPISPDDTCIVLFNDRNIDIWHNSATVDVPASLRTHSLSDGLVLVGVQNLKNALPMDDAKVELHGEGVPVEITTDDTVKIAADLGTSVSMTTGKFSVKNTVTSGDLFTVLDGLIDAISNCNVGALNSGAFKLTIQGYKTLLGVIMEAGS